MDEHKKLGTLRILEILSKYTDEDHKLTQQEIIDLLEEDYGIILERKAVSRSIDLLADAGLNVFKDGSGTYIKPGGDAYIGSPLFTDAELHFLIDNVLCSANVSKDESKSLIERLAKLSNKYFKKSNVYSINERFKTSNDNFFKNIESINTAIEQNKKITFDYLKYCIDKKMRKSSQITVSPYLMFLQNQKYYLMGYNDRYNNISYLRIDHISNIKLLNEDAKPLREVPSYANGIDYKSFSSTKPYMYTDTPERVTFLADESIIDQLIDWFGDKLDLKFSEEYEDKVVASLIVSPQAMEYWAMQYVDHVEILSPASLREKMLESVKQAYEKYLKKI